MADPLSTLVDDRSTLLRQICELGDFQPGSITSATRRCGKPGCHCAKPNDPGTVRTISSPRRSAVRPPPRISPPRQPCARRRRRSPSSGGFGL